MRKILDRGVLEQLLDFDGTNLIWKSREVTSRIDRTWNTRFAGKVAGCEVEERSIKYMLVSVQGTQYYAHRIVWCMFISDDIPDVIDHIDRNGLNNNPTNLRDGCGSVNSLNTKLQSNNKSGIQGVRYCAARSKWVSQGYSNNQVIPLGRFPTMLDAVAARKLWELQHPLRELYVTRDK